MPNHYLIFLKSTQVINGEIEKKKMYETVKIISVPKKWKMPCLVNKTSSMNFIFCISTKFIRV